ncbi:hypothetical protein, partial [Aneurinibacillus aneurinilyticus]
TRAPSFFHLMDHQQACYSLFSDHMDGNKLRSTVQANITNVWAIDCHLTLFFYYVSNAQLTSH